MSKSGQRSQQNHDVFYTSNPKPTKYAPFTFDYHLLPKEKVMGLIRSSKKGRTVAATPPCKHLTQNTTGRYSLQDNPVVSTHPACRRPPTLSVLSPAAGLPTWPCGPWIHQNKRLNEANNKRTDLHTGQRLSEMTIVSISCNLLPRSRAIIPCWLFVEHRCTILHNKIFSFDQDWAFFWVVPEYFGSFELP